MALCFPTFPGDLTNLEVHIVQNVFVHVIIPFLITKRAHAIHSTIGGQSVAKCIRIDSAEGCSSFGAARTPTTIWYGACLTEGISEMDTPGVLPGVIPRASLGACQPAVAEHEAEV